MTTGRINQVATYSGADDLLLPSESNKMAQGPPTEIVITDQLPTDKVGVELQWRLVSLRTDPQS